MLSDNVNIAWKLEIFLELGPVFDGAEKTLKIGKVTMKTHRFVMEG